MSSRWRESTAENDYSLTCPGCVETVPEVLLCIHDDDPTGPLCPSCCERDHPHQCRACRGAGGRRGEVIGAHGRIGYSDRPEDFITCGQCEGTGRVNERRAS